MLDAIATFIVIMILAVFAPVLITGLMIMGGIPVAIILAVMGMFRKSTN